MVEFACRLLLGGEGLENSVQATILFNVLGNG